MTGLLPDPTPPPPPRPWAPPLPTAPVPTGEWPCSICGSNPAIPVEFTQNIGMFFVRRTKKWQGHACRECGQSVGRKLMNLTLVTGWTGLISFVMNIGAVAQNWQHLHQLRKLPAASRPAAAPSAGRPVFLRPGIVVAAAVAATLGFGATRVNSGGWSAGSCAVVEGSRIRQVGCGVNHNARVYTVIDKSEACPPPALGSIIVGSKRHCIRAAAG